MCRIQKGEHMTIQELEAQESESYSALDTATKAFEAVRATASITDLQKLANAVTTATRTAERAATELANFALIGIYEQVKSVLLKLGDKLLTGADIATLLDKNVNSVTVTLPLTADGIEAGRIAVNTLGKRTVVKSGGGGNGQRAKWLMRNTADGATMSPRDFLEAHGDEAFGADAKVTAQMILDKPAAYGLTDYAERAGAKLTPTWEKVERAD